MSITPIDRVNGHALPETSHAESWARAGIAEAEAEAIRARTAAELEERARVAAAELEVAKLAAAAQAEKDRIANERAALRLERERAEHEVKIAEAKRRQEEADRKAAAERKAAEKAEQEAAAQEAAAKAEEEAAFEAVETSSSRWRRTAKAFYALCAAVALPVQVAAFYDDKAKYLVVAPVFIELIALVALVGAAAAVTANRPHWHYRLVAWAGALTAATINIVHGLAAFDPATAFGTALASIAGPGMWDLHEHGRIARRDGRLTWRQRRAAKKAATEEAKERAAAEEQAAAEREAAQQAVEERARELAAQREKHFPKVWQHAVKLAAALGETTVTEAVWKRAHNDIEGTDPSESVDIIRGRNAAARRVLAARSEAPGEKPSKVTNAQRVPQMPPVRHPGPKARATRRAGDTPKYVAAARTQAAIAARAAAKEAQS